MRNQRRGILVLLTLAVGLVSIGSSAADIGVGVVPPDGAAMLVKRIHVPAGSTILGVEFETSGGTFPEVLLVRGAETTLGEGTIVARSSDVVEVSSGSNQVRWSDPVYASEASDYWVAVRIPTQRGTRMRARDVAEPTGSYLVSGTSGSLTAVSVDLVISLLTSGAGSFSAKLISEEEQAGSRTFLAVQNANPAPGIATIGFGLERAGKVAITIYDVGGRQVRELVHETFAAGKYARDWDGRDVSGKPAAAGIYLVLLQTPDKALTRKLVLTR